MKKTLVFVLAISIIASCTTSNQVVSNKLFQKRKYKKGWHVNSINKIDKTKKYEETELALEETNSEEVQIVKSTEIVAKSEAVQATSVVVANNAVMKTKSVSEKQKQNKSKNNSASNEIIDESPAFFTASKQVKNTESKQVISTESNKSNSSNSGAPFIVLLILCFLLPPVTVGLVSGWSSTEFIISIVLTLLFWVPGIIYALLILLGII